MMNLEDLVPKFFIEPQPILSPDFTLILASCSAGISFAGKASMLTQKSKAKNFYGKSVHFRCCVWTKFLRVRNNSQFSKAGRLNLPQVEILRGQRD